MSNKIYLLFSTLAILGVGLIVKELNIFSFQSDNNQQADSRDKKIEIIETVGDFQKYIKTRYKIDDQNSIFVLDEKIPSKRYFSFKLQLNSDPQFLSIPEYDIEKKSVTYSIDGMGIFSIEEDKTISIYTKGIGYGGLSIIRKIKLIDGKLVLISQKGTKDRKNKNYQLNGSDEDWYVEYEKETKK